MNHSETKDPKVSVIVPVYRVEQYLDRCVGSLRAQTYADYEVILVDDGSPDRSPEMCDRFAAQYAGFRVIHKENGGLSSARLAGFEQARGEYILFVDSDDYIDARMLEKLVHALEAEQAELAICAYFTERDGKSTPQLLPYTAPRLSGRARIESDYILPLLGHAAQGINIPGFVCLRLMRRALMQPSFFASEREYFLEDHVFDLLYADGIRTIAVVNEPLYHYCYNGASLSNRYRENKWGMYQKLLSFYRDYVRQRNLRGGEERMTGFLHSAFHASVDNAVLSGSYRSFRGELGEILRSEQMREIWATAASQPRSGSRRLTLLLCRCRACRLLYALRKRRLRENTAAADGDQS